MIAAIENSIIARLKSAEERLGYVWKTAETYPADWDAFLKDKRQINVPGFWIGFAGAERVSRETSGQIRMKANFGLVVMARHHGNEQSRRHGAQGQGVVGSYQLMEDAIALLEGQTLGIDIDDIECGTVRHVRAGLTEDKSSMLALQLTTEFVLAVLPTDLDSDDPVPFETFHANWDIAPFGGIDAAPGTPGTQIPDDEHADATDHVELEQ